MSWCVSYLDAEGPQLLAQRGGEGLERVLGRLVGRAQRHPTRPRRERRDVQHAGLAPLDLQGRGGGGLSGAKSRWGVVYMGAWLEAKGRAAAYHGQEGLDHVQHAKEVHVPACTEQCGGTSAQPTSFSFHCMGGWPSVWLDHFPEFIEEAYDHLHDAPIVSNLEPAESTAARGA